MRPDCYCGLMKTTIVVGDYQIENPCLRFLLKYWQPRPTVASTVWTYSIFAVLMYITSIVLFVYNAQLKHFSILNYNTLAQCSTLGEVCTVNFSLPYDLKGPVSMQYELSNFYQNNKKYMMSKSGKQLEGYEIDEDEARKMCKPVIYNKDLFSSYNISWGGTPLDPDAVANPCGLIAKSIFNDTYTLAYSNGTSVYLNKSGIAWGNENIRKFRRAPNSSQIQWIDPIDQHFMVWMRTSSMPHFLKPWGTIQKGLPSGDYALTINNNYDINLFNSNKSIKFSSMGNLGSQNFTLPIVFLVFGSVFWVGVGVFLWKAKVTEGSFGPKIVKHQ